MMEKELLALISQFNQETTIYNEQNRVICFKNGSIPIDKYYDFLSFESWLIGRSKSVTGRDE